MEIDLFNCMQSFITVAETGSYTRAALQLQMSVSVISRQIQALEQYLGLILITRSTRSLQLTKAGHCYLQSAKRIIKEVNQAAALIRNDNNKIPNGIIQVSLPGILQSSKYIHILAQFTHQYPEIKLSINNSMSPLQLLDKTADIVISEFAINDKQFIQEELFSVRKQVFAAPAYLNHYGQPHHVAELIHHNCLIYGPASPNEEWEFAKNTRVKVSGNYKVTSGTSIIPAAVAGIGLLWVETDLVADEVKNGQLVALNIEPGPYEAHLKLYYLPIGYHGINKLLIDTILSSFKN